MLEIFKAWDHAIFPGTKDTGLAAVKGNSNGAESFNAALEMLGADEVEEEDENENAEGEPENA